MDRMLAHPFVCASLGLVLMLGAVANFVAGHLVYAAVLSFAGTWFAFVAAAAAWTHRAPADVPLRARLLLGDVTIVVMAALGLGIVGFEAQLASPFLPLYAALVAHVIVRRRRAAAVAAV